MSGRALTVWVVILLSLLLVSASVACSGDDDDDDDPVDDDTDDDDAGDDDDAADDDDSADDDDAGDDDDDDDEAPEPLVFVQITDIHQSRGSDANKGRYENFYKSLEYIRSEIRPDFVVATGDLTDGSAKSQSQIDWDDYKAAIADSGYTADDYHDLPGNHDGKDDEGFTYYLANGVSGATMHAWNVERDGYEYAFLTTLTAEPGVVEGRFYQEAYDWTQAALSDASDATHVFLFAHHNSGIFPDVGLLGASGLVATYEVTAFVAGHRHYDLEESYFGTRFVKTANHYSGMPDSDDGWMRIFVLTGETWAHKSCYVVDRGPQVIITRPQDGDQSVTRSLYAHAVTGETEVAAMAFGETVPETLYLTVDSGAPVAMTTQDDRTYAVVYDFDQVPEGDHTLRVADPGRDDNTNGVDEITVLSF